MNDLSFSAQTGHQRSGDSFLKITSFSENMESRGRVPSSRWVSRSAGTVTPEESLSLGLSPGAAAYRFHRLRFVDGVPMAIEILTIADLDMAAAVVNAARVLRISPAAAAAMAATHPAAFLGLAHARGALAPGLRADWVVMNANLSVRETWIGGEPCMNEAMAA